MSDRAVNERIVAEILKHNWYRIGRYHNPEDVVAQNIAWEIARAIADHDALHAEAD